MSKIFPSKYFPAENAVISALAFATVIVTCESTFGGGATSLLHYFSAKPRELPNTTVRFQYCTTFRRHVRSRKRTLLGEDSFATTNGKGGPYVKLINEMRAKYAAERSDSTVAIGAIAQVRSAGSKVAEQCSGIVENKSDEIFTLYNF